MLDALDTLLQTMTPQQLLKEGLARQEAAAKTTAVAQFPSAIPFFPSLATITPGMEAEALAAAKAQVTATQTLALGIWLMAFISFLDAAEPSADYATAAVDVQRLVREIAAGQITPTKAAELLRALAIVHRRVLAATPHIRTL